MVVTLDCVFCDEYYVALGLLLLFEILLFSVEENCHKRCLYGLKLIALSNLLHNAKFR